MEPENSILCAEVQPPVRILIQVNQWTHFKIHFDIIISSMPRFFISSVSFRFSHKEPLHMSLLRLLVMTQQTLFDFNTANNFW